MFRTEQWCALLFLCTLLAGPAWAGPGPHEPTRYALSTSIGTTYDPVGDRRFALASWVALIDYDRVWPHRAPAPLRFKVEATAGATLTPDVRTILSANIFALYYLERFSSAGIHPYAEAGVGLIYTDFRVAGQGLRFNFNPQVGIGAEFGPGEEHSWFAAVRLHHVSNGNLHADNRGINGVLFTLGRYFQ